MGMTGHMTERKTVLVAGANGVLGGHMARALRAAGHDVIGLSRGERDGVAADILDRSGLLRAVEGLHADVVVHAVTALRKPPMRHRDMALTDSLRVEGTSNLLDAAVVVGARQFVVESVAIGYGYDDFGDRVLTEADPFAPPGHTKQMEKHLRAMRLNEQQAFEADGIDGVALRFGFLYGPGGTEALVAMLRKRMLPAPGGHGVLPWVDLRDAGSATVAAIERGRGGEAYNIVDDTPMSFGDHVRAVARAFGTPKPITVPLWAMRPMGFAHATASANMRVSNAKAKRDLGWTPISPASADGLRALADSQA
jgi:nucleoside-diphosphate-sugar epimerase